MTQQLVGENIFFEMNLTFAYYFRVWKPVFEIAITNTELTWKKTNVW